MKNGWRREMARIRSVKPDIWQDEGFGNASHQARLLFIGLITQADDEGLLNGAPRLLWSLIYPWEDFDPDSLDEWLAELEGARLIQRYDKDGRNYIALPSWKKHQKISHPTRSKLPRPPRTLRKPPEPSQNGRAASSLIGGEGIGGDRSTPQTPQRGPV
jgi:hypothetical protein